MNEMEMVAKKKMTVMNEMVMVEFETLLTASFLPSFLLYVTKT